MLELLPSASFLKKIKVTVKWFHVNYDISSSFRFTPRLFSSVSAEWFRLPPPDLTDTVITASNIAGSIPPGNLHHQHIITGSTSITCKVGDLHSEGLKARVSSHSLSSLRELVIVLLVSGADFLFHFNLLCVSHQKRKVGVTESFSCITEKWCAVDSYNRTLVINLFCVCRCVSFCMNVWWCLSTINLFKLMA